MMDELDIANAAVTDAFILKVRRWKEKRGGVDNSAIIALLADIYGVDKADGDHPCGPILCLTAELLLRLVNTEQPELHV